MDKLFGKKISPACAHCAESFVNPDAGALLCLRGGAVDPDHSCKKYRYDPLKRVPARPIPLGNYDKSDFEL